MSLLAAGPAGASVFIRIPTLPQRAAEVAGSLPSARRKKKDERPKPPQHPP